MTTQLSVSDKIRQSVKEWLKTGDNRLPDELKDLLQHNINPHRLQFISRRIVERYKNRSLSLHFHIQESFPKACESFSLPGVGEKFGIIQGHHGAEYCAVAQFLPTDEHADERVLVATTPINKSIVCDRRGEIQCSVLINVVEVGECPERFIPTAVRLQTLDQCSRLIGNAAKPACPESVRKTVGRGANRKHVPRAGSSVRLDQDKLHHEMVKGRPSIKKKIADDKAEPKRGLRKMHSENPHMRLLVFLGNDVALAFGKPAEDFDYSFKMFVCPT